MKKLCILGASMIFLALSSANAQVRFGLVGGANLNNQLDHYQGETNSNQAKTGVHAGGLVDICLTNNLTLQPGLMYIMKGGLQQHTNVYTQPDGTFENKIKDKLTLHYIELPLELTYRFPVGRGHLVLGAGGYAAGLVAANSKFKYKTSVNGNDIPSMTYDGQQALEVGNDEGKDDVKAWDFGLLGNLGYEFSNGWFIRGGVDAGLTNIVTGNQMNGFASTQTSSSVGDNSSKNMSYLFSVGYWFRH